MRVVILSVLVVCCAFAHETIAEVSKEERSEVSNILQPFLDRLIEGEGFPFKLVKLIEINDAENFEGVAEFEINGDKHTCTFNIQASTLTGSKRDHFGMKCDNEKKYHAAVTSDE